MAYVPFRLDEILRAHMSGQDVLSALIYIIYIYIYMDIKQQILQPNIKMPSIVL